MFKRIVPSFSALRRIMTYLRSSMTDKRLNNLTIHKDITDTLNLSEIAEEFISFREERRFLGSFM